MDQETSSHAALPSTRTESDERKRLARLLHDDVQPLLVAARMRLPKLRCSCPTRRQQEIDKLESLLMECLTKTRDLSHELCPPVLEIETLSEALEWLADSFSEDHGLRVTVATRGCPPPLPTRLRTTLYAAVRELLLNVVKHSGSLEARVDLSLSGNRLTVCVEDGGRAFDAETVAARLRRPGGLGLSDIRERLSEFHGRVEIERTAGGGASFRLIVPVPAARRPAEVDRPGWTVSSRPVHPHAPLARARRTVRLATSESV